MADFELRNESSRTFADISMEARRTYRFETQEVVIERPQWLSVSDSGGHLVVDLEGTSHYLPPRWIELRWEPRAGAPHVVA